MTWNNRLRQTHRWVSIAFTVAAAANVVALVRGTQAAWLGFLALVPLVVLLLTGLYLFWLPYAARRRGASPAD